MTTKAFSYEAYTRKGMTWDVYLDLVRDLLSEDKTTGENQSPQLVEYTALNLQRMERIYKTVALSEALVAEVKRIIKPQTWLCISEAWCGDAAQNLPVFAKLASHNPLIQMRVVLRDENAELMDMYLTKEARAIPIVIAIEADTELWHWGPRPESIQQQVVEFKKNPQTSPEEFKVQLHTWYARNKAVDLQDEILKLLK